MAASAYKHALVGVLGLLFLGLASCNRVLKESVHTESVESHSEDGLSSAWAGVSVAGNGHASSAYGSGYGTGVGIGSGSGLGVGIGVGEGGSGLGTGIGSGSGIGEGTGIGMGSGGGGGIGIGIGTGSGSGNRPRCDQPNCSTEPDPDPECNPGTNCNPTYDPPCVHVPGGCNQGIVYIPPVCLPETGCYSDQIIGVASTKEIGEAQAPAAQSISASSNLHPIKISV